MADFIEIGGHPFEVAKPSYDIFEYASDIGAFIRDAEACGTPIPDYIVRLCGVEPRGHGQSRAAIEQMVDGGLEMFLSNVDKMQEHVAASIGARVVKHDWVMLENYGEEQLLFEASRNGSSGGGNFSEIEMGFFRAIFSIPPEYNLGARVKYEPHERTLNSIFGSSMNPVRQTVVDTLKSAANEASVELKLPWKLIDIFNLGQYAVVEAPESVITDVSQLRDLDLILLDVEPRTAPKVFIPIELASARDIEMITRGGK